MRRALCIYALMAAACGSHPASPLPAPTSTPPPAPTDDCGLAAAATYELPAHAQVRALAIAWNGDTRLDVAAYVDDTVLLTSRLDAPRATWVRRTPPEVLDGVAAMSAIGEGSGRSVVIAQRTDGGACVVELGRLYDATGSASCFGTPPALEPGSIVVLGDDGVRTFFAGVADGYARVYAIRARSEWMPMAVGLGELRPVAARSGHAGAWLLLSAHDGARAFSLDFAPFDFVASAGRPPTSAVASPGAITGAVRSSSTFTVDADGATWLVSTTGTTPPLRLARGTRGVSAWTQDFSPAALLRRTSPPGWLVAHANVGLTRADTPRDAHTIPATASVVASEPYRENGWTIWAEPRGERTVLRAAPSSCL